METPILSDPNQFPTEEIIFSFIGKSKKYWEALFEFIHSNYPEFSENWKFYKDGKSWLCKITKKTKTIFWLSIIKNSFRITFYFTDKAEEAILISSISDELKNQFEEGKHYNKIRGLTVTLKNKKDVEFVKTLIEIKLYQK